MKKLYFLIFLLVATLHPHETFAESGVIDFLSSTGKIYSVVLVIVVIFLGIVFYLRHLDKKLTKLENQIKDEQ